MCTRHARLRAALEAVVCVKRFDNRLIGEVLRKSNLFRPIPDRVRLEFLPVVFVRQTIAPLDISPFLAFEKMTFAILQ